MPNVCFRQIEYALPDTIVTNADLQRANPDWDMEKIVQRTGIVSRRIAAPGELASDLGYRAVQRLLASTALPAEAIDAIVFCTLSPDYILPSNASLLHARLNLPARAAAFDLTLGCSGFVYATAIARGLIQSLGWRNVILVTGDTPSGWSGPRDRTTTAIFGDGAAATWIAAGGESPGIVDICLGAHGSGVDKVTISAGRMRVPSSEATRTPKADCFGNIRCDEDVAMDGGALVVFAKKQVPAGIREFLRRHDLEVAQLDLVLFHQANACIIDAVSKALGLSETQRFNNLREIGNTMSASLPILIKDAQANGRLKPGDLVLLAGFGAGYSWGYCLVRW